MTYEAWLAQVPSEFTGDPLSRMHVYRLALFLADLSWHDVSKLAQDRRTVELSDQLFRAVGAVHANIAEGYAGNPARIRPDSTSMPSAPHAKRADGTTRDATS
jgi:hypothetical protein